MIRHIFKIIWNERRSNTLIFLEFIVVFCVLWFCLDYLYYVASRHFEPHGYDIAHTYIISMDRNNEIEEKEEEKYDNAIILKERVEKYPGVESVSFSEAAIPYGWSTRTSGFVINNDSARYNVDERYITPEYFDIFKLHIEQGRIFSKSEIAEDKRVVLISADRNGYFGSKENQGIPVEEVKELRYDINDENKATVIGITEKQKRFIFSPFESTVFSLLQRNQYHCQDNDIVIRVNPAADNDFAKRFTSDMQHQLVIGPYSLGSISPLNDRQKSSTEYVIGDNLKSVLSITAFLIINILLGIVGTFWLRTESRINEIGLRIAMGSSKKNIQKMMLTETIILLTLASVVGVYVCINLGESDLLQALGIPLADYQAAGFGSGHYMINYAITLLFLILISGISVWIPARQASRIAPAEALRNE